MAPITILQKSFVHPANPSSHQVVHLSHLDCTTARFSPTGLVLFFPAPPPSFPDPIETLRRSLSQALSAYPFWAGQLFPLPPSPSQIGRLATEYGTPHDPGVHLYLASTPVSLSSVLSPGQHGWYDDRTGLTKGFLPNPQGNLAGFDVKTYRGLPGMIVQLTTFSCGAVGVGVEMVHPWGDVRSLRAFLHVWEKQARSPIGLELGRVRWEPELVDLEGQKGDEGQDRLPLAGFDFWNSSEGAPGFMKDATVVPEGFDPTPVGPSIPWGDWDLTIPIVHYVFRFSTDELARIHTAASLSSSGPKITSTDALSAHLWRSIVLAQLSTNTSLQLSTFQLHLTLGLRTRIPSIRKDHLGSPITMTTSTIPGDPLPALPLIARQIRESIAPFNDPLAVRAFLRKVEEAPSPTRQWHGFLGRRNTMLTTWLNERIGSVDFGWGMPRYAEPAMPDCEGLVVVWEEPDGVTVGVRLGRGVMGRVVEELRMYKE